MDKEGAGAVSYLSRCRHDFSSSDPRLVLNKSVQNWPTMSLQNSGGECR
jgi:hypothetical protein